MPSHAELFAYIQACRAQGHGDDAIRAQLVAENVPAGAIEAAFKGKVASRAEEALTVKPSRSWVKLAAGAGVATVLVAGAVIVSRARRPTKGADGASELSAADQQRLQERLNAFVPTPLAPPPFLPDDLPAQGPGNAAEIYWDIGQKLMADPVFVERVKARKMPDPNWHPELVADLERAAATKESRFFGRVSEPHTGEELKKDRKILSAAILFGTAVFQERAVRFIDEGNLDAADRESRNLLALAFHMESEWDAESARGGARLALKPMEIALEIRARQRRLSLDERLRHAKLALQGKAFVAQHDQIDEIERLAADPREIPSLRRFCEEPALERPYCAAVVMEVADRWSDAERAAATPAAARAELLHAISKSADARVAAMGRIGSNMLAEVQRCAMGQPCSRRVAAPGSK